MVVAIHVAADHGLQPVGISSGGLSSIGKFPMLIITLVAIHVAPDHGLQLQLTDFGNCFPYPLRSMWRRIMVCNRNG